MRAYPVSAQRRIMLWFFDEPANDPYVSLTMDVNIEPAQAFLDAFEREHQERVGLQHLVTAAVARMLRDLPALNVKILRRTIYQLERVDVAVPVHLGGGAKHDETGMTLLIGADRKSLLDIARETRRLAREERQGAISAVGSAVARQLVRHTPRPIAEALMDGAGALLRNPITYQLIEPWIGVGTAVTNIGAVFDLPAGARFRAASAALPTKLGHVASAFALAPACEAPVVEEGQVVVRRVLPITMIVDHRAIDGYLMAKTGELLARSLLDPATLAYAQPR